MKATFTAKAYLPTHSRIEDVANGSYMPLLSGGDGDYFERQGYPEIGEAIVTITLFSQDKIIANRLQALQDQLQTVRAENQKRENAILDQISKLQALPMAEVA